MKKRILLVAAIAVTTIAVLTAVVAVRYLQARRTVDAAKQSLDRIDPAALGSTESLTITPLFEAWSRTNDFLSGHGVSYLIQTDQATVLFDLGNNEQDQAVSPLAYNMQELDIAKTDVDCLVISHNHPDHTGGARWWKKGSFSVDGTQSALDYMKVYLPEKLTYPEADLHIADKPSVIAPGIATLGKIPYVQPFPFWLWEPLGWEQSLAIHVDGLGLVIVSGCGHPGLERIVRCAEQSLDAPVKGIFGGFHYLDQTLEQIEPQLAFLQDRNPELVALSPHDSSGEVLQIFEQEFASAYRYILVGTEIAAARGRIEANVLPPKEK